MRGEPQHSTRRTVGSLAFRVVGSAPPSTPRRPTIVLVHGIGMSHRYLSRLHRALGASATVYSVDLPGFGGLPKPGRDVGVPAMAAALADVIGSTVSGPVVLVGHSMGAQWVVELAVQRPDLVSRLVIIGPVADAAHRSLGAQAMALGLDTLGETPRVNAIVFTDYLRCGIPWYLVQARHMLRYRLDDRVRLLTMPLLVLRGAKDPIAGRAWCRAVRDAAPEARLVVIPRGHHVVQESAPSAVAAAILADHA